MSATWRPKPGDRVVRRPREEQMSPVRLTVTPRLPQSRALASPLLLIYAVAVLIALGTLLLLLPFTHHGGGITPIVDALFTATSAVTVTGLATQDTATYWTRIGQVFILAMIFVGGLGFMTISTFLIILFRQRVTLAQRILVRDSLQIDHFGGLARLTAKIVLVAVAIQLAGFVALLARFSLLYSPAEAIWLAAFHSVSAFNSAGFTVFSEGESLSAFKTDKSVLATMATLIFLGAISYWVIVDVVRVRRFSLFTLTTKLVLIVTFALIVLGALSFLVSEYSNEKTLGPRVPIPDKAMVAVFESISGRTAGFSTVDYGETEQPTNLLFIGLMFVGGASASVAGGIKVNTLAIVLVAVLSTLGGRGRVSSFGREIRLIQVRRAMSIGAVGIAFVFFIGLMLTFAEGASGEPFAKLLFEAVSAAGTVGLSTGVTADLSRWGHLILVASMFLGRVGPLTLALYMTQGGEADLYRYAQERVTLG